ncbi:MAG: lytic transglycosylase domain-containing protein [Acidobacteriota bacterium]|nr:lytic transglycosylase domain-containing protein [Acidobacteriota bacterium]
MAAALVTATFALPSAGADRRYHAEIGPPYQRLIERVAQRHKLNPRLLQALVEVESARNADAVSHAGAVGLAQLMPQTARRFGVSDRTDPAENLDGGARYLAWLLQRYRNDIPLALAAYNAGEGNVDRHGGIPPFAETQGFVRRVLRKAGMSDLIGGGAERVTRAPPARVDRTPDGRIQLTNVPSR